MARLPRKARSDWKLRPRAGSFQRKSLDLGMCASALACGLCWSWLWVARAGAADMPATTRADTARTGNRHDRLLTLTTSVGESTASGIDPLGQRELLGLRVQPGEPDRAGRGRIAQAEQVEALGDLRLVDEAVVPIGRPGPAELIDDLTVRCGHLTQRRRIRPRDRLRMR